MNFYKHNLGDYDGHTAHLTWDEDMAYTRLLRAYYRREGPIPTAEVYRLTRATTKAQKAAVDSVLVEFFRHDGSLWRQKRADEEIAEYQSQRDTNRRIARERTVPRTVNEPSTNRSPKQNQNHETEPEPLNRKDQEHVGNAPKNGARHAPDTSEILITLPLREGGDFEVRKSLVAEVEPLCPAVDVPLTLKEMKLWLVGNPDRRKTRKGIRRFITGWLKTEQEKHGG